MFLVNTGKFIMCAVRVGGKRTLHTTFSLRSSGHKKKDRMFGTRGIDVRNDKNQSKIKKTGRSQ
jgi:hypothetical protein